MSPMHYGGAFVVLGAAIVHALVWRVGPSEIGPRNALRVSIHAYIFYGLVYIASSQALVHFAQSLADPRPYAAGVGVLVAWLFTARRAYGTRAVGVLHMLEHALPDDTRRPALLEYLDRALPAIVAREFSNDDVRARFCLHVAKRLEDKGAANAAQRVLALGRATSSDDGTSPAPT